VKDVVREKLRLRKSLSYQMLCHPERAFRFVAPVFGATKNSGASRIDLHFLSGRPPRISSKQTRISEPIRPQN
jgi:hypothetical protein